jgi:hypothetical protein
MSHVGPVSVYDLDAVAVKVEYCGIEVTIFRATSTRGSVRTPAGSQCSGIEIPDRGRAGCGECDVCSAGLYARRFLAEEEIGIMDSQANLVAILADIAVAQWLKRREKEGR